MLSQVQTLQENYYYEYDVYSPDLIQIGFEQEKLITEDGRARYLIEIEKADALGFIVWIH